MVTTTIVVGYLLELTDALSAQVLSNADGQAVHFLSGFGLAVTGQTFSPLQCSQVILPSPPHLAQLTSW